MSWVSAPPLPGGGCGKVGKGGGVAMSERFRLIMGEVDGS